MYKSVKSGSNDNTELPNTIVYSYLNLLVGRNLSVSVSSEL